MRGLIDQFYFLAPTNYILKSKAPQLAPVCRTLLGPLDHWTTQHTCLTAEAAGTCVQITRPQPLRMKTQGKQDGAGRHGHFRIAKQRANHSERPAPYYRGPWRAPYPIGTSPSKAPNSDNRPSLPTHPVATWALRSPNKVQNEYRYTINQTC